MQCRTMPKSIFSSKINWIGLLLIILGGLIDPKLYDTLASVGLVFPEWFVAELIRWVGFIIIIVRSFMTTAANIQPGPNTGPVDVWLDENGQPVLPTDEQTARAKKLASQYAPVKTVRGTRE